MPKSALVVLAVLAAAAAAFLVLRTGGSGGGGLGGSSERDVLEGPDSKPLEGVNLQGTGLGPRPRTPEAPVERPLDPRRDDDVVLRVRVLDDASGAPVAGARVMFMSTSEPCPRLPPEALLTVPGPAEAPFPGSARPEEILGFGTDAEGALAVPRSSGLAEMAHVDVFARASGYVIGAACAVAVPGEASVRLVRALPLRGHVTDRQGKRLAGALLSAEPGPATPHAPGHAARARTDEKGDFAFDGLLAGPLTIVVGREGYYPLVVEQEDPADPRERAYVLLPAYVLKFRLRADDGRELVNPTLEAMADVKPPFHAVRILRLTDDTTNDGRLTEGVALPATLGSVALEVKADGCAAWRAPAEVVPPEGGEHTYLVTLGRDTGQGSVRLVFEDERGKPVKFAELGAAPPNILALERQDLAGGIVYEVKDDLRFPSLPPGRYRFGVTSFAYAPVSVEAAVTGGAEAELRVPLRAAARLKVRFSAPSARIVRFRIVQGRTTVLALPEKAAPRRTDPGTGDDEAVLSAGVDGVLLGGLASGAYVVEVTSEDLQPSRTPVEVREGETEEVEIRVQPR